MSAQRPELDFVIDVAKRAGATLMEYFGAGPTVRHKGTVDLVTDADLASEKIITSAISRAYPEHTIMAEEGSPEANASSAWQWIIDPLDGTTNFVHGLPLFGVSIGLQFDGDTVLGVVYNPAMDELYAAESGGGATLNGQPISVSGTVDLQQALFVTGFPYVHDDLYHRSFELFHEIYNRARGGRRLGAAALDCCYVAAGRFDFFYEANLKPWDLCAGDLICREAGGRTSDWSGGALPFDGRRVLLSNGHLHAAVLEIMAEEAFATLR